jgi:O-antigen/teichoic acid export membrane protein
VLAQRLNIIAVATLMSDAATGWFAAGARVVEGLKAGHLALLGALFPVLARRPLPGVLRRALVLLLVLAAGLALAASLSARPIILLLYGPRFEASVDALQWQAWTLVPYTVTAVISLWFVATGAERSVLFGSALSLPVMLALYIFLIPRLGWLGAAWAMLGGECLQAVVFAVMFILQPRRANELVMDAFGV